MDSESFSNLYQKAYPRLVVIACALIQDRIEACDVVQQAALVAIERIDQFLPTQADALEIEFTRWMAAIVRNLAANTRRKQKFRRTIPLSDEHATSCPNNGQIFGDKHGEELGFNEVSRTFMGLNEAFDDQLRDALETLSEISRICLLLNVVLHLTLDEIGQLLELPPGTVASHVSRAKKLLRALLQDYRGPAT